jgi:hypothetical protein
MEQSALLLSWVVSSYWLIEPVSQKLSNPPPRTIARVAPHKAPPKAFVAGPQDDAMVQQFKQQWGPQFQQLYKTELHFMRLVCQPTKQQYQKIAADGEPVLQATINKFAATWRRPVANEQSEPRTPVVEALVKSVRSTLSPEQAARYQKELDRRTAARKRSTVISFVSKIDHLLVLTAEQRVKLGKILENNWNDSWNHTQWLTMGGRYFPPMPDDKILPILTETQKRVWRETQKGNIYFGFNLGFLQGIEMEEEVWDDDRPQENSKRAGGKPATKARGTSKPVQK